MVNIQEKLEKGHIHAKVIIEIGGKPKDYVDKALNDLIGKIKEHTDYTILNSEINEAKEMKEQKDMFLAFAEMEILAKDISSLAGFCFDYMPSSIEILAPQEMKISALHFSHIINDLQGKLHKLDMGIKQSVNENRFLQKNIHLLLRNLVTIIIGKKGRTVDFISKLAGMEEKEMKIFLDNLVKKEALIKEGDLYKRQNAERKEQS